MDWSDVISHARLFFIFFTDQSHNPWQGLAELLGCVEHLLKIYWSIGLHWTCIFTALLFFSINSHRTINNTRKVYLVKKYEKS